MQRKTRNVIIIQLKEFSKSAYDTRDINFKLSSNTGALIRAPVGAIASTLSPLTVAQLPAVIDFPNQYPVMPYLHHRISEFRGRTVS